MRDLLDLVDCWDDFGGGEELLDTDPGGISGMCHSLDRKMEVGCHAYVLMEKLLTPMALAFPLASTCSISAQVSLNVGVSRTIISPSAFLGSVLFSNG